jgi:DNA-damage-inducible protein J
MSASSTFHIDSDDTLRREAEEIYARDGLTYADVVRRLLLRTVAEQHVPLDLFSPNAETSEAMHELDRGGLRSFDNIEALMADLNADD